MGLRSCVTSGNSITDNTASFLFSSNILCKTSDVFVGQEKSLEIVGNVEKSKMEIKLLMGREGLML